MTQLTALQGENWLKHLPAKFDVCIKELIDHTIADGDWLFVDTRFAKTWMIYHDALSQWWEKEAQEYIKSKGMFDRQWRARGATNDFLPPYYRDKLMSDSPELMPLDSSLFGDLVEKVAELVTLTVLLSEEEKYSMATPDKAWRTMVDAWTQVPESRIIEDVDKFVVAIDAIIAAEGCYVSDKDLRNGHRKLMQKLVRGGAVRKDGGEKATAARLKEGLKEVMMSWDGWSAGR